MYLVISNSSNLPIYEQIKEQIKSQILKGELVEDEKLPSLRQLAKDLKISVLTTTRAYNELEEEGFITSQQGKGFFVMPRSSGLIHEQLVKKVENSLNDAIEGARQAEISDERLSSAPSAKAFALRPCSLDLSNVLLEHLVSS